MVQPFTTQAEVDEAYESGISSFRVLKSAFPEFQPRAGWQVREVQTEPVELIVVNTTRERTIIPKG